MKKLILIILIYIVHYSLFITHCNAQWYQITLPVSGSIFHMQFINSNTGWATISQSGVGYILIRTTNQGTNWFVIYSDSSKVGKFQFINDTLGYAIGYSNGRIISKTTNSGYNWFVMQQTYDVLNGFYMINADTGWVNAFNVPTTFTLRTTNGFQTMEQISTGGGGTPATLYFFKEKYNGEYCGYVLGAGILSKTTNSGYNWQQISFSGFGNVNSFSFINKDTGWITYHPSVTQNSQILYTINAGQNWSQQFISNIQGDLGNIQAINNFQIRCGKGSYNKILISTSSGINWGYQTSPINDNGRIYFYDTLLGFAWNDYQTVRTTNGGGPITQISNIEKQITNSCKLYQNYPNPFNSETNIEFTIPKTSIVNLSLYDILGRKITDLINNKEYSSGGYRYTLNLIDYNLSSGVYIYKINSIEKESNIVFNSAKKLIYNK